MSTHENAQKNIDQWLNDDYDEETKEAINTLIAEKSPELNDAFYTHLEFGTGGLRGIMGVGTNRMNKYTVAKATQGLANYINQQNFENPSVLIGYDSRHHSKNFAEEAAKTLAGNGIKVYLFDQIRPTPLVSFGCRLKKCSAAIMVTASHNPPQYNGYKVYWNDGGQVVPPHDKGIIAEFLKIQKLSDVHQSELLNPLIKPIFEEVDEAYLKAISKLPLYPQEMKEKGVDLKIVYTSLHGTGITLMPEVLKQQGFSSIEYVSEQIIPDGDFPTAPSPNPEEKETLKLGIEKLIETESDLLIATDPDADRVGIAVRHNGEAVMFNGNQVACICLEHLLSSHQKIGNLPINAAFIKTIVTTELFKTIAESYNTHCFDVLTGFKYVAEKIREWEKTGNPFHYMFGGEESYGYLWGTQTRDKDALSAALLICEVALMAKLRGKTLVDLQHDLNQKYGLHLESLATIKFEETQAGREKMTTGLKNLRKNPPKSIGGVAVDTMDDYDTLLKTNFVSGEKSALKLARNNTLVFWLKDGSKIMVRPSGTEPKVKIYCGVKTSDFKSDQEGQKHLEAKAKTLIQDLESQMR